MNMNRMEMPGSPIPTDKGSPRPARLSKVMPQAVFGKIILAGGCGIFPKNPAQLRYFPEKPCTAGTRHLLGVGGMEPPGSTYIKRKRIWI